MKTYRIALLPGDGIGPEVVAEGVKVLSAAAATLDGVSFDLEEFAAGAEEFQRSGDPFPETTFEACRACDAILLGAMGLPHVRGPRGTEIAPQLDLRERLDLYAGLRPIHLFHPTHTPLKGYEAGGIDLLLVRENTEGAFWSREQKVDFAADVVDDQIHISRRATERVCRAAFHEASRRQSITRRGKVTLVDKSNVLPSMAFFRRVFDEVAAEFPAIETERVYVDAAALYLVRQPERFDVIVTENLFGDILSDLAAGLVGGMGMAPSGDIGESHAVFQPSHGSAPDIAGQGIANPVATILSVAMMLEWLGNETRPAAVLVRGAVERVLQSGENRTRDLGGELSSRQMGDLIVAEIGAEIGT
ncbi:MAG: isocitrate/isopropylmalate dehydrogenase family protein [Acidobacteria bacterium]|nr:isocitrate/isopropylmalate dehydrogenase family protein [Acidobacteriota bacterium]